MIAQQPGRNEEIRLLNPREEIENLVRDLRSMHSGIEAKIPRCLDLVKQDENSFDPDKLIVNGRYWKRVAYYNTLLKLSIIIERNFSYIESLGVLSLTRYIFELAVWVNLLSKDEEYGLLYYRILIKNQQGFYDSYVEHIKREMDFLSALGEEERIAKNKPPSQDPSGSSEPREIASRLAQIEQAVDEKAALTFSIFADQAKSNGCSYQASLVSKQVLPNAQQRASQLDDSLLKFDILTKNRFKDTRWKWNARAKQAGMEAQYRFIYAYTSKVLHANPDSVTTDQKCLEDEEVIIFLKFIRVAIQQILKTIETQKTE